MSGFNQALIEEFRANRGNAGGPFAGSRLILLTTTGRRSGQPHTVPVEFLHDGGGATVVIASAAGLPSSRTSGPTTARSPRRSNTWPFLAAHLDHEEREIIPALNALGAARA